MIRPALNGGKEYFCKKGNNSELTKDIKKKLWYKLSYFLEILYEQVKGYLMT
jgi:hypothetical protein